MYNKTHVSHPMLRSLTFLLFVLPALLPAAAQQPVAPELPDAPEARHSRLRAAKGYYYDDIDGEYCKVIVLNDIAVYPQLKFKNKKEEDFYWKTVYNVRKTRSLRLYRDIPHPGRARRISQAHGVSHLRAV